MANPGLLVLPQDLRIVPVNELPEELRHQFSYEEGDFSVTRLKSRQPSSILGAQSARLLQEFQEPISIAQAILNFSRNQGMDPQETLEETYPLIQTFVRRQLLVKPDKAEEIVTSFTPGSAVLGWEVVRVVQFLEDTEIYQVKKANRLAALKIGRKLHRNQIYFRRLFEREAAILKSLSGSFAPELIESGIFKERPYLFLEWCGGIDAATLAAELRQDNNPKSRQELLNLACAITEAFCNLHEQGILHGDVHPGNIIVGPGNSVKIIDYGLARRPGEGMDTESDKTPRGGVGFFFEPEYARAQLGGLTPPVTSSLGEQYALAALLYFLFTGHHYVEFSLESADMLREICEEPPRPFQTWGLESWPGLENILGKALSKEPNQRYSTLDEFGKQLKTCLLPDTISLPAGDIDENEEFLAEVLAQLDHQNPFFRENILKAPQCSINLGAAGIAYALYRIACQKNDPSLLALADVWSGKALKLALTGGETAFKNEGNDLTPETIGLVSLFHTISGVYTVQALISRARGDIFGEQQAIEGFITSTRLACDNLDLTLGKASLLIGTALLIEGIPGSKPISAFQQSLFEWGNDLYGQIWEALTKYAPVSECSEISYLGLAHGWAGILYATLRWSIATGVSLPPDFERRIDELAGCAEYIGRGVRWKWVANSPGHNYMPGWCNGSAGYIYLWTAAYKVSGEQRFMDLAEKTAWNIWETSSGVSNLCCGLTGQSYALVHFFKITGDPKWLQRANQLAKQAITIFKYEEGGEDYFEQSLFRGKIGIALLLEDLKHPDTAIMPLIESE